MKNFFTDLKNLQFSLFFCDELLLTHHQLHTPQAVTT